MSGPLGVSKLADNPIKCQFHNGQESVQGWIIRKIGNRKFRCQDANGNRAVCHLVQHEVRQMSSLTEGQMIINVKLKDGSLVQVGTLKNKVMTIVSSDPKLHGTRQPWSFDTNPGFTAPNAKAEPKPAPAAKKEEKTMFEQIKEKVTRSSEESEPVKMEAQVEEDKL